MIDRVARKEKRSQKTKAPPSMEALARSALSQAAEALVVCDTAERILLASEAARRLCDQDPISKPFHTVLPLRLARGPSLWRLIERRKRGRPGPEVSLAPVLQGEMLQNLEVRLERPDGARLSLLLNAAPLRNGQGEIKGCVVSLTDITSRKRAEEALQESEARFTRLAESNVIGIFSADSSKILEANEAFLRIVGYRESDLSAGAVGWREITPPEYRQADEREFEELTTKGSFASYEREFVRKDGRRVPVLVGGVLLEAVPFRWAGFVVDQTERKKTEEALRLSEERFRLLAENAQDLIYRIRLFPTRRFEYVSPAALRITGYTPEEHYADPDLEFKLVHPDDRWIMEAAARGEIPAGTPIVIRWVHKDGTLLWTEQSNVPIYDEQGRLVAIEGIARDITEHVRAEDTLRRREEQFRALVENSPDIIDRVDRNYRHLFVNPAAARLTGMAPESFIGKTFEETGIPEVQAQQWREEIRKVFETARPGEMEFGFPTEEGVRFFQCRLVPELASDGSVVSVLMVSRDFTDLKHAEEALQEAKIKLELRVEQRTAELTLANASLQAEVIERKRAEEALLESRAQFQSLLESAPDAIVTVNQNGEMVLVNDATARMFGYSKEELIGQPVEMLLPARYGSVHRRHRMDYHAAPATRPMGIGLDLAGRKKDGTEFPVEISLSPVETQEGDLLVTSIIRDITERQRAQHALQEQAARLQEQANLLELAHDAIIVRDLENRILSWNHGAEELYGWTREQALGKETHAFLETRFGETQEDVRTQLLAEGRWEGELGHSTRDGRHIVVSSRQVLHRNEQGEPRAILEINRDITEAKRAEEALRQSEERFRAIVEQVKDYAIFGLDPEGRVVSWNEGAERITGYRADEIIGRHFSVFYPPEDLADGKPARELAIASTTGMYKEEGQRLRKGGSLYWAEVVITALRDRAGHLRGFAKVTRDITERKEAEEQIQRLNHELEHRVAELAAVNQELETFSYSVSHDLRSPLRGIAGFSQALLEDYGNTLDPQGQDYARRIHAATQRMTQLIDDMLNLSRVTRSEMNRETVVDLSSLVTSIAGQLQSTQPERKADWVIEPGLTTRGDPRLMRIALENLLGNAWKFTGKQEHARIEFGRRGEEDGKTVYFVRDNGAGFDMAYADKLFGPFQRLHSTGDFPGTGIGLATVQRIIHRHGGRIWAESAVGQGTTFYMTLS